MTIKALQEENRQQQGIIAALTSKNDELTSKLTSALSEQERLKLLVKKLQGKLFGKSSERRVGSDARQELLFAVEQQAAASKETPIAAHTRRTRSRLEEDEEAGAGTFPEHLRREDEFIDDKPSGYADEELEVISTKVTERLDATPGEFYVRRFIRRVFKVKSTGQVLPVVPAPQHVLGKPCKVSEAFLVLLAINKFLWHLPIYRQQQALKLHGVKLSRESLVRWTIEFGGLLLPIAQAVANQIRGAPVVHIDETPVVVGKGAEKKYQDGYLWPILAPGIGVAFHYRASRVWAEVAKLLKDFSGVLVSDAYEAYEDYVMTANVRWQLCWMHIRRNFVEAEASNKELAEQALSYIRELYAIEAELRDEDNERRALGRQRRSQPVLEAFHQWLVTQSASAAVLTDELMTKAVWYVLKRWDAACLFVWDGAVPIDNGAIERAQRPSKLGARNWLHCASETGAETVAIFYTLVGSALMHGIHPYYYLLDLTKRLDTPGLSAYDLTPLRWKERFFEEAVPEPLRGILTTGVPFIGDPDRCKFKKAQSLSAAQPTAQ